MNSPSSPLSMSGEGAMGKLFRDHSLTKIRRITSVRKDLIGNPVRVGSGPAAVTLIHSNEISTDYERVESLGA